MFDETPLLRRVLGQPPDRIAVWSPSAPSITYGALAAESDPIARLLLAGRPTLGGASVGLLLPPGPSFVAALLAVWRAGGVAVPLSASHTAPELGHILKTAAPDATIVGSGLGAAITTSCAELMGRRLDITVLPQIALVGAASPDRERDDRGPPERRTGAAEPAALMLFTSGTTGKPKGVMLSHAGVAATLESLAEAWRWRADDRLLCALPLYHTHGLIVALLGALWAGASVRFMSFDADSIWDALEDVSVFMAVPTMYVRLVDAFAVATSDQRARWAAHARALRLFTSGSAALPAPLLAAFAQATGQTILERYGMTEIGMALSNPYDGPRVAGSVGTPLPGVGIDIVDDAERPVADGEPGELRVRSPQLFLGYHGDPQSTAGSYDRAGRFRTGDTGVRGTDGFIRLLGRTSVDILKSGGYKLSALEIEDVLRGHPAVAEIAVIGVPDPVWGDRVTACVVLRDGATVTLEALRGFGGDALAPYKLPRELRVLTSLPRNSMGKVRKSLLK